MPAEAILTRLDDRLGFLTGGARDTPLRHRTLHATIDSGNLSRRRLIRGERGEAKLLLTETLLMVRDLRSATGVAYYSEMVAALAADEHDHATSVMLFSAASTIRAAVDVETPPVSATNSERAIAAARAAIGDDRVEAALASGAKLETCDAADKAIAWTSLPEGELSARPAVD